MTQNNLLTTSSKKKKKRKPSTKKGNTRKIKPLITVKIDFRSILTTLSNNENIRVPVTSGTFVSSIKKRPTSKILNKNGKIYVENFDSTHPTVKFNMGSDECCSYIKSQNSENKSPDKTKEITKNLGSREETGCYWCALKILRKDTIGIPMKIIRCKDTELISGETQKYIYKCYTFGSFCCFGCTYAYLKSQGINESSESLVFSSSISNLRLLFRLSHPGKELKASPNRILHKRYGGFLDDKSFYSGKYRYSTDINLMFVPVCITGTIFK